MTVVADINATIEAHAGAILLSMGIIVLVTLALALVLAFRMVSLTRPLSKLKAESSRPEDAIPAILHTVEANRVGVEKVASELSNLTEDSRGFLQSIGFVRYDAFDDIGGQQSYSLCLLDGKKNGVLVTYLTGRNSTRSYAVQIDRGEASRKLSDEEIKAFREALSGGCSP